MKLMKLRLQSLLLFGLSLTMLFLVLGEVKAEPQKMGRLSIGGATMGGAAYQVSAGHAKVINKAVPNIEVTVEVTGGGADNVKLVNAHKIDIGVTGTPTAYQAFRGIGDFKEKKLENIRGWVPLYDTPLHFVVLKNSPIKKVSDLKGKKVSVGVKGSGVEIDGRNVVEALGLTYKDFTPVFVAYNETMNGLIAGALDAAWFSSGAPIPSLIELGTQHPFQLIPLSPEELNLLHQRLPWESPGIIKAGTYPGIAEDVAVTVRYSISVIHKEVPDDLVYKMTKAVFESLDVMAGFHPSQKLLTPGKIKAAMLPVLPIHPGAEKYYREVGAIK